MSDQIKLGQLVDGEGFRDAIHIAIAPVVAAEQLEPGDRIGFVDSSRSLVGWVSTPLGIVDPFLRSDVKPGERFYMLLFPHTITSLRHEWTHPAFDVPKELADYLARKEASDAP